MTIRAIALLLGFYAGLVGLPGNVEAQPAVARVGLLRPAPPSPEVAEILAAFKQGLQDHGYVDGRNLAVEFRYPSSKVDRLSDIATELIRLKPDAILVAASSGMDAIRKATTTIPIVALDLETDPVATKVVASLSRPGGNVTGIFLDFPELGGKWLELVKEIVPQASRVAASGTRRRDEFRSEAPRPPPRHYACSFRCSKREAPAISTASFARPSPRAPARSSFFRHRSSTRIDGSSSILPRSIASPRSCRSRSSSTTAVSSLTGRTSSTCIGKAERWLARS